MDISTRHITVKATSGRKMFRPKYLTCFLVCQQLFGLLELSLAMTTVVGDNAPFPTTLDGWNLAFNGKHSSSSSHRKWFSFKNNFIISEDGELKQRDWKTGMPGHTGFVYNIQPEKPAYNKRREKALYKTLETYVYDQLREEGLQEIWLTPTDPTGIASFVFCTHSDLHNTRKLLILIHGSGDARAGSWEPYLIVYQSLNKGTMLPLIRRARENGYDVLVMNPNDNKRYVEHLKRELPIPGSENAINHAKSVWNELIAPAQNVQNIAIVAHDDAGGVVMALTEHAPMDFIHRVMAVALTDSQHHRFQYHADVVMPILRPVIINFSKISMN